MEMRNLRNSLRTLGISANNLTRSIPQWLGNVFSLEALFLLQNNLHGSIPDELGGLAKLKYLQLSSNHLSGKIPRSVFNLSSLVMLSVTENQLHGRIPSDVGFTILNLEMLLISVNHFYGEVPPSLLNATRLRFLDMGANNFSGGVPSDIGRLRNLVMLLLPGNQLVSVEGEGLGFITSLTNCSNLRYLQLNENRFTGELPTSVANLSTKLERLTIGDNQISGEIPEQIENLVGLTVLQFAGMDLTGEIPSSLGKLKSLSKLHLAGNWISGSIPSSLGNLTALLSLSLFDNSLGGLIPPSLGNCSELLLLFLYNNNLTGIIPKQLFSLSRVVRLYIHDNALTGQLPLEIGNMTNLVSLYVSDNQLSGTIPIILGNCLTMEQLLMAGNLFEGGIPLSFNNLKGLKDLDLSRDSLSGQIPRYLQNFTELRYVNLSFNEFEGELPVGGVFGNGINVSVTGNPRLCGGIHQLGLPPCEIQGRRNGKLHRRKVVIAVSVSCSVLLIIVVFLLVFLSYRRKLSQRKKTAASIDVQEPEGIPKISFAELSHATNGFSPSNLIGEGSFGSVYKGILGPDGMAVAVKVLNLLQKGASKSFIAECEALRNIRHRNLIKIVTVCSNIDFKGTDFKALVYECMQNGNLDEWLHPNDELRASGLCLSFTQRLNIAVDVACALEYLHDHCTPPIVHGDLKPSNVLLDEDTVAHVGDFGLARFLSSSQTQSSSIGIKGTIGYVAPEYGMNRKASKPGDAYAFGILLLEMITGKRPTDAIFKDGFTIHQFTKTTLPERQVDILEPSLLREIEDAKNPRVRSRGISIRETLVVVARIGVLCSMEIPNERMGMKQAAAELNVVRDKFFGNRH